jgi:hypothetical protein
MLQIHPFDQNVSIFKQLNTDASPVILINIFQVREDEIPALLKAWENDELDEKAARIYFHSTTPGNRW